MKRGMFLAILLIIIIFFTLLYFMPITIKINYSRQNKDDEALIYIISLYGLMNYKVDLSFVDLKLTGKNPGLEHKSQLERTKNEKTIWHKEERQSFIELKNKLRN